MDDVGAGESTERGARESADASDICGKRSGHQPLHEWCEQLKRCSERDVDGDTYPRTVREGFELDLQVCFRETAMAALAPKSGRFERRDLHVETRAGARYFVPTGAESRRSRSLYFDPAQTALPFQASPRIADHGEHRRAGRIQSLGHDEMDDSDRQGHFARYSHFV